MSTAVATPVITKPIPNRRPGYVIAIVVNAVLLWVANNLLAWEWPKFLTDDFAQVLPYINLSLAATMAANLIWLAFDPAWFRSLLQIGLNLIAILVSLRMYAVFPFDFSAYTGNWETVARILIVIAVVASAIGVVAETFKLIRGLMSPD